MTTLPAASAFTAEPMTAQALSDALVQMRDALAAVVGADGTPAGALATLGALLGRYEARAAAGSVTLGDRGKWLACSGTWILSLLAAATAGAGFSVFVSNAGSGTITLDPADAETVDGAATAALGSGRSALLMCTGSAWLTAALPGTAAGPVLAADGTAAAPSLSFSADPDTGIYRAGGDTLGFATAGAIVGRFDSAGRFIVGPGASQNVGGQGSAQVIGAGARFGLHRFNAGAGFGPIFVLSHSRSNTIGEVVSLNSGDAIGQIQFYGASTGGAYAMGADITASVADTPSGGDMPAHLRFRTTPVGGTTPTERVRITAAGQVGIGTASPTAPLHVNGAARVGSFTVATVPSASGMGAGSIIYVSNETGGAVPAFSDGTNWRRVTDRAIIS
jgi:hypothetical protein